MDYMVDDLKNALHAGFIHYDSNYNEKFKPQLLTNNSKKNETVLDTLVEELENCVEFSFSVAFITEAGLATLKSYLYELEYRGVRGRILTSTYLLFNKPKIFKELIKIRNLDVRITNREGFHTKGYIFSHKTHYTLIVGSSNLTAHALKVNEEWNVRLSSLEHGEMVYEFQEQFNELWKESQLLTEDWITLYEKTYAINHLEKQEKIIESGRAYQTKENIEPNMMQQNALREIKAARSNGADRALVISATGTGKTYLSAFDVAEMKPKRMLFIAHRERILTQAQSDYQRILGGEKAEYGLLTGAQKDVNSNYLFASIWTLSQNDVLEKFSKYDFDYILIDEVHKAGASSYQKIIDYFKPKFLLGMTATPERTDEVNIFELFNYNIAYEIRLQEALEEKMLTPFHYFGVTDLHIDGEVIDEDASFSKLVTEERVRHIIEKIEYYGYSGEAVRGLMFCSRNSEAKQLSQALNENGYRTLALSGENSDEERSEGIKALEENRLDYILTVDIFNEGIDIPSINQVVMLRQTESSIVFVQQLGRGLRLHDSKDFLTVIDFIGNYKNNYLIPVALAGDQSQNKDNLRRHTQDTSFIKGVSTVNFEEIARKRVFDAIDKSKLTYLSVLKGAFENLEYQIGRIPYLFDFIKYHSIDPMIIGQKYKTYYEFLTKMKKEQPILTKYELKVLEMLTIEILDGKRKHELILLNMLIEEDSVSLSTYKKYLLNEKCRSDQKTINSVLSVLDLSFFTKNEQKKYGEMPIVEEKTGALVWNESIRQSLNKSGYFLKLVKDVVYAGLKRSERYSCKEPLTLYEKYSRKDACKLLNWHQNQSSTVYGYSTKHDTSLIFIRYDKDDSLEASIKYGDEFLSPNVLRWYSTSNRTSSSKDVVPIINAEKNNTKIHIFVQKSKKDGVDHYYLGEAVPDPQTIQDTEEVNDQGKKQPIVKMNLVMKESVDHGLYRYLLKH